MVAVKQWARRPSRESVAPLRMAATGGLSGPKRHGGATTALRKAGCTRGRGLTGGGVLSTTGLGLGGGGDGRGGGEGGKGGLGGLGGGGGFGGGRAHESNRLVHELEVVLQQPLQQGLPATQTRPAAMHGCGLGAGDSGREAVSLGEVAELRAHVPAVRAATRRVLLRGMTHAVQSASQVGLQGAEGWDGPGAAVVAGTAWEAAERGLVAGRACRLGREAAARARGARAPAAGREG